jgi:two-component system chemotaxis response regulator CheB
MAGHDIIVVGASAGGVEVLVELVRGLPPGLPAAVFIVCHFPAGSTSVLPDILSRSGPLLARHAHDGDPIYPGHIYIAPPDTHMQLQPGQVQLTCTARENGFRPAIDPLFRSAARAYGPRVIGVVLTGALYDGVAGLLAVRGGGGIGVVQDPRDAVVAALPQSATTIAGADHVVRTAELAPLLVKLVHTPVPNPGGSNMADPLDKMPRIVDRDMEAQADGRRGGGLSVFTCPECGGAMWQVDESELVRFRCHVGHSYDAEALLAEQSEALEAALWTAVRTFREKSVLARQPAERERQRGHAAAAERFEDQTREATHYGQVLHQYLVSSGLVRPGPEAAPATGAKE